MENLIGSVNLSKPCIHNRQNNFQNNIVVNTDVFIIAITKCQGYFLFSSPSNWNIYTTTVVILVSRVLLLSKLIRIKITFGLYAMLRYIFYHVYRHRFMIRMRHAQVGTSI